MKVNCHYTHLVPTSTIKPNPKNPNKHTEEQIEKLAKIIEHYGFRVPIIISKNSGFVVSGHGRLEAAKKLGYEKVPVDYQEFKNKNEELGYLVSDNAIAELSFIDKDLVKEEIIPELEEDFDLDILAVKGLDVGEINIEQDIGDKVIAEEEKVYKIIVRVPNEMEMRDLIDELNSRGYLAEEAKR